MWEGDDETFGEGSPDQAQDIAYGGSGDVSPASGSEEFFTQMILGTGKADPRNLPPTPIGEDGARQVALPSYSKFPGPVESPAEPSTGYLSPGLRINPDASWWDWFTALPEIGINTLGTIASGGWLSPDLQLGKGDVLQYVDSDGNIHSDISHYGAGKLGPQDPGLQVDVGYSPITGATVSLDQKGLSYHTPFDPGGTIDKATELVGGGIKAASDYLDIEPINYGNSPTGPYKGPLRLATGGLASLPQISQSGLYRAMGRG